MEKYTVVTYTGETKPSWGLIKDNKYAVETNEDLVMHFDNGTITVWADTGHLAEMTKDEYEISAVDETLWFDTRPEHRFVEEY